MLWYDRCIQRGKELIGTRMDLPGSALVGSRAGSSSQCEADPSRLGSYLRLNFWYVVADIKMHLLQKESPHLVGQISRNVVVNLGQQCWSREPRGVGRCFRGWGGCGKVPHLYRRDPRVCFEL
jgi:hypothetical protein